MVSNSSLVATSTTTRTAYTGLSLADGFQGLHQSVRGGSWVDGVLAGGAFVGDAAATVIDPFGTLLANGLGWVMEHFEPLREVLDKLAGIPDQVVAHAQTWANMAGGLRTLAEDLQVEPRHRSARLGRRGRRGVPVDDDQQRGRARRSGGAGRHHVGGDRGRRATWSSSPGTSSAT